MEYEAATKAIEEENRVQQARRDFDKLKAEEEKYLAELEEKSRLRLSGLEKSIKDAAAIVGAITDRAVRILRGISETMQNGLRKMDSMVAVADRITKKATSFKETAEKILDEAERRMEEADGVRRQLSAKERELLGREKEVDRRHRDAEEKLARAEELAFWAKKPGAIYRDKPNKK